MKWPVQNKAWLTARFTWKVTVTSNVAAATVRRRIDLPIDGLSGAGKPAIRRLTLLRETGDVLLAITANTINWMLDVPSSGP